jgi:hypothetical protein
MYILFCILRANLLHIITGYKYIVFRFNKRIYIRSRKHLKQMVTARFFRNGVTIYTLERNAIFITK